jgi:hypothetical protein
VCRGHKTLMHYFSCSGGPSTDLTKSTMGHIRPNFCFCIWRDLGHIVHFVCPGRKMSKHYFHARVRPDGFDKKNIETCHAKLVFLHPVGSAGHVVHSGQSRP